MHLIVRQAPDVTESERLACYTLWDRLFPQPAGEARPPDFAEASTVALLLHDGDGALVGACRLRDRTITVDGVAERVAGLASVAVVEAHRGRGYGVRLVRAAADTARDRGYAYSVLFCSPGRRGFYERLGWQSLDGEIRVGPPDATAPLDTAEEMVMALPLTPLAMGLLPAWRTALVILPNYW
jgi:predicted N-acetyltransferase YhbS